MGAETVTRGLGDHGRPTNDWLPSAYPEYVSRMISFPRDFAYPIGESKEVLMVSLKEIRLNFAGLRKPSRVATPIRCLGKFPSHPHPQNRHTIPSRLSRLTVRGQNFPVCTIEATFPEHVRRIPRSCGAGGRTASNWQLV